MTGEKAAEEEVEAEYEQENAISSDGLSKPKKKKKRKKKKPGPVLVPQEPIAKPPARGLKESAFTDFACQYGQTNPPTIPVADLFKGRELPIGELHVHPGDHNAYRETSTECRAKDLLNKDMYKIFHYLIINWMIGHNCYVHHG